jgi:FkbM family methyltransferase
MNLYVRELLEQASRKLILRRQLPQKYGGARFFVSGEGGLKFLKPSLSQTDTTLLRNATEMITKGSVVWDVGANIGLFTFASAGLSGPSGRVVAIEPDLWLVSLLKRSAQYLGHECAEVSVIPAAADAEWGIATLAIAKRARASNHLTGAGRSQTGGIRYTQQITTLPLDALLQTEAAPQILKIDVEGVENRVLSGAKGILRDQRPVILCEVSQATAPSVSVTLLAHDYDLFDGDEPPNRRRPLSIACWNTLAVPRENRRLNTTCPLKPPPSPQYSS